MTATDLLARLLVRACCRCGCLDGRSAWGAKAAVVAEWRCPGCGSIDARLVAPGAIAPPGSPPPLTRQQR